ncbi:HNH endonuclease [Butyrivibrio hungatei]|uniref:HNH endonuclease family protein n=1 Tax=Butyrivibrio hungatei TaxID=185008 RepID=A0A1D9NYL9_9FIRM|nr:HNH endonuclease domain-containing protein [Butyrivibrio hungatei]AOZ95352.1 HNH endonuclease family protein [Butyrivibrio hungatei]
MAAGYQLKKAEYVDRPLSEDEMWSAFAYLFSSKSHNDTSYKYGFLKAIIDNLYNTDDKLKLNFDQLFSKFAEIYWNLVLKHHIKQKNPGKLDRRSRLETILFESQEKYNIIEGIPFESLACDMRIDICKRVKSDCKNNVVGALYADLGGLFYSFSLSGEWIQLNPRMYEFACKHKVAIEKLNYYEWARFLERVNEDNVIDHLLSKIDESTMRTRSSLAYYRDILFEEFENKCFYCGKRVTRDKVEVDHFIPWSFIKDDQIWNFVLACPECNNMKRDKLAQVDFLEKISERNEILIERDHHDNVQPAKRIKMIYNWAQRNGYNEIWTPRKIGV